MTNEYEWIERLDGCNRVFGFGDALMGWCIYGAMLFALMI